jgi:hypothetical protein
VIDRRNRVIMLDRLLGQRGTGGWNFGGAAGAGLASFVSPNKIGGNVAASEAGRPAARSSSEPQHFQAKTGRQSNEPEARPDVSCIAEIGNGSSA